MQSLSLAANKIAANYVLYFHREVQKTSSFSPVVIRQRYAACVVQCAAATCHPARRSGNYKPSLWDFNYIQSLNNDYLEEKYAKQCNELKIQVKMTLNETIETLDQLELIDNLQRLGVSNHFEEEIDKMLTGIYKSHIASGNILSMKGKDLYTTALGFRLLRQHGFNISPEVFQDFYDNSNNLNPSISEDIEGLLQWYEASFLLTKGESALDLAKELTMKTLQEKLDNQNIVDDNVAKIVQHALELPLHWRPQQHEARWFISVYEKSPNVNPTLLQFAKLSFNIVQASHQKQLKDLSRWWRGTRLAEKLPFARNRLVESFVWIIVNRLAGEPKYSKFLQIVSQANTFTVIIDDIYDVYGTLEELELFTSAIERWDSEAIDQLPDYMRAVFLGLNKHVTDVAHDILMEHKFDAVPYLRKVWMDLCQNYFQEAKWYHSRHMPSLREYLEVAHVSVSGPLMMAHAYFALTNKIEEEALQLCQNYGDIICSTSTILRLVNDLGTSSDELERGDVPKSIQCFMHETGANEEQAREHIKFLICETWKKVNKDRLAEDSPLPEILLQVAVDINARMSHYMYHNGDGFGIQDNGVKSRISELLFEPIPFP